MKITSFKKLGVAAIAASLMVGFVATSGNNTEITKNIDDFTFNHFNTAVFQDNHDYMKNEYKNFVYKKYENKIEDSILKREIEAADKKGFFEDPHKFKVGMEYFKELRKAKEERTKEVHNVLNDALKIKENINKIRHISVEESKTPKLKT